MSLIKIPIIEPVLPDFFTKAGNAITRDRLPMSAQRMVYARQHGKCAFSGVEHSDCAIQHYDHIVSVTRGGLLKSKSRLRPAVKYWNTLGLCKSCNNKKYNFDIQYFFVGEYCHVHGFSLMNFNYPKRKERYLWFWKEYGRLESARPSWLVNVDGSPIFLEDFDEVTFYKKMIETYVPRPKGRPTATIAQKHRVSQIKNCRKIIL
jgi:hypothetical protein